MSTADRILVLTNRPGTIKGELVIRFPNHEMSPLKRRNYPEFSSYFNELWKILGNGNGDDTSTVDGAGSGDTDIINGTESGDENAPAARNGLMTLSMWEVIRMRFHSIASFILRSTGL